MWLPTDSEAILSVAWPEASSAALPKLVAPSKKVTVPLGVPAAGATATTVAVRVMACPDSDGLTDVMNAVAVDPAFTVRLVLPVIDPLVAVMVVPPVVFAVARPPASIPAAEALVELQITDAVRFCVVLSV